MSASVIATSSFWFFFCGDCKREIMSDSEAIKIDIKQALLARAVKEETTGHRQVHPSRLEKLEKSRMKEPPLSESKSTRVWRATANSSFSKGIYGTPDSSRGGIQLARACGGDDRIPSHDYSSYRKHTPTKSRSQSRTTSSRRLPIRNITPGNTPKSWDKRRVNAKTLFPNFSPSSPFLSHPPLMSSTLYGTPKKHYIPLAEAVYCYHCGNTINIVRACKMMEQLSKPCVQDLGRTVFDLEKLSDTGLASKCISSIESDSKLLDGCDILSAMLRTPSILSDSLKMPSTPTNRRTSPEMRDEDVSVPFARPVFNTNNDALSWQTLDILDVEEMLKLLETTPDQPKEKERQHSAEHMEQKEDITKGEVKEAKSVSPIPKRQLRPRKQSEI